MASIKRHVQHVKSSISGKTPTTDDLLYGEIAVNYFSGSPALYIKDSADKVIKINGGDAILSKDYQQITYPTYLVPSYPSSAGTNFDDVTKNIETTVSSLTQSVLDIEDTFAQAVVTHNTSCGFNTYGNYIPLTSSIISGATSLTEAINILAQKYADLESKVVTKDMLTYDSSDETLTINTTN